VAYRFSGTCSAARVQRYQICIEVWLPPSANSDDADHKFQHHLVSIIVCVVEESGLCNLQINCGLPYLKTCITRKRYGINGGIYRYIWNVQFVIPGLDRCELSRHTLNLIKLMHLVSVHHEISFPTIMRS